MFTIEELNILTKDKEHGVKFVCGVPLDIYPDLTAVNCSPLSKLHRTDIRKFDNVKDLVDSLESGFMTPFGIYEPKCQGCELFRNICFGGCKSFYKPNKENENDG
jgi:radical SAM protein with 4Fe4S-binding SPASM domain